jgi:hypothetical protein
MLERQAWKEMSSTIYHTIDALFGEGYIEGSCSCIVLYLLKKQHGRSDSTLLKANDSIHDSR